MMEWKGLDSFRYLYKGGVDWSMIARLYKHAASTTFKLVLSSIVAAYDLATSFVLYVPRSLSLAVTNDRL